MSIYRCSVYKCIQMHIRADMSIYRWQTSRYTTHRSHPISCLFDMALVHVYRVSIVSLSCLYRVSIVRWQTEVDVCHLYIDISARSVYRCIQMHIRADMYVYVHIACVQCTLQVHVLYIQVHIHEQMQTCTYILQVCGVHVCYIYTCINE